MLDMALLSVTLKIVITVELSDAALPDSFVDCYDWCNV